MKNIEIHAANFFGFTAEDYISGRRKKEINLALELIIHYYITVLNYSMIQASRMITRPTSRANYYNHYYKAQNYIRTKQGKKDLMQFYKTFDEADKFVDMPIFKFPKYHKKNNIFFDECIGEIMSIKSLKGRWVSNYELRHTLRRNHIYLTKNQLMYTKKLLVRYGKAARMKVGGRRIYFYFI